MARAVFPFAAIVGQEDMKLRDADRRRRSGHRRRAGVRRPRHRQVHHGPRAGRPAAADEGDARAAATAATRPRPNAGAPTAGPPAKGKSVTAPVPVVDLPLGATEDRVVGALDLERALAGAKVFEPGLLARANRGFLYIDEVNLLEDHLVDLLLDVAASGENVVEREGLSIRHPARFVLIGSGNPEEGELRPQLLDRFGLSVEVRTPTDLATRIEVIRRRDTLRARSGRVRRDLEEAAGQAAPAASSPPGPRLPSVDVPDTALERAARLCMALGTDGLRGELTLIRAAGRSPRWTATQAVGDRHLRRVAADGAGPPAAPQPAGRSRRQHAGDTERSRNCSAHERRGRLGRRAAGAGAVRRRSGRAGRHLGARRRGPGARPLPDAAARGVCRRTCRCAACRCTPATIGCWAVSIWRRRCRPAGRSRRRACWPRPMAGS